MSHPDTAVSARPIEMATADSAIEPAQMPRAASAGCRASGEAACVIALLALALLEPLTDMITGGPPRAVTVRAAVEARPCAAPGTAAGVGHCDPRIPGRPGRTAGDVTVRYPGMPHPAVRGISGEAQTGRWLVLDGPSGSGKSTLLSAIMGALPTETGAIVADGHPITGFTAASWRERVAWCPQDAYVFDSDAARQPTARSGGTR